MAPKVIDDRARQAAKGRPVLIVLVASLVLVGIFVAGMMVWSGSSSRDIAGRPAEREATTGSVTGSGRASSSNTSGTPAANPAYPAPATPSANPNAGR
jgi:flagellar basal body-associated protein FliL